MLTARDLFPRESNPALKLPLQGRIFIRTSEALIDERDIQRLISMGSMSAIDDPDEAHRISVTGW